MKEKTNLEKLREDIPLAKELLSKCWMPIAMAHRLWMPSISGLNWKIWDFGMKDAPLVNPTACTDGDSVWINSTFFVNLTQGQRIFLIAHEILHPLLNHLTRLKNHRKDLINEAADYEVNNLLIDYMKKKSVTAEMEWIENGVCDTKDLKFKGLSAEVIAVKLDEMRPKQSEQSESGDGDSNQSSLDIKSEDELYDALNNGKTRFSVGEFKTPKPGSKKDIELQKKWSEIAANTANAARLCGDLPDSWVEKLENILTPPVDLVTLLDRYLCEFIPQDESYRHHRPTLYNVDVCVPDEYSEQHGTLVFVKDTSGSVSQKEAEAVISCIESGLERLNCKRCVVLDVDSAVAFVQEVSPGEKIKREFHGRGGTDFRPAFDWTEQNADEVRVLIYFTDGCGVFPKTSPSYPVIWINFNKSNIEYPWGEVVDISEFIES